MLQKFVYILLGFFCLNTATGQKGKADTVADLLDEIVITGTRTENKVSNIPLPIQIISAKNIQLSGSQKLIEVLQMQAGLVVAANPLGTALQGYPNPFGDGVQMQGLDPAYTLILIDGEPVTGRNAGILNLDRIALGNIKQIEILKGPATSLYGSDALAGVINIITAEPEHDRLHLQTHYGTNQTIGLSGTVDLKFKESALQLFAKRLSSGGYDFDKNIYGKTIDPYTSYTANVKWTADVDSKNKFSVSARYGTHKQKNKYKIYPQQEPEKVAGNTVESDKSLYAKLRHTVNPGLSYTASVYGTTYSNNASVFLQKNDELYEQIELNQLLIKPELQINIGKDAARLFIAGAGYNYETINSTRYSDFQKMHSWYAFVQKQFQIKEKTNIILGARVDKNSLYIMQLNPKVAIAHKIAPALIIKGSIGAGFKAPDFRQQFLNFNNSMVGYTIIGAHELGNELQKLKKNGLLDNTVNILPYLAGTELSPEKSIGINLGLDYSLNNKVVVKLNFFRNDINNLIEAYSLPFRSVANQGFYSYRNVSKVFTEGMESNISYNISRQFTIYGGYQYLLAKDKSVVKNIKNEKVYQRDPETLVNSLVTSKQYKGLFNRSRNTAHLNLRFQNKKYQASALISAKYRGRFGFNGLNGFENGNNILDDDREFIDGFVLMNAVLTKEFANNIEIQGGVENILNYTNKLQMPGLYGRSFFINCNLKLDL